MHLAIQKHCFLKVFFLEKIASKNTFFEVAESTTF